MYENAIQFLLAGNLGGVLAVLCASLLALPAPFAPVHLLFINLLTDSLPTIAIGLEPHNKKIMNEKPWCYFLTSCPSRTRFDGSV